MKNFIVEFNCSRTEIGNPVSFFVEAKSFSSALEIGKKMRKKAGINGHKYSVWSVTDAKTFYEDQIYLMKNIDKQN